jgi:hypothetical protein
MKYYAAVPAYFNSPKNKLEAAVHDAISEFRDFVFSVKTLPVVKSSILQAIEVLNKQHHRCKPITAYCSVDKHRTKAAIERAKGHDNYQLNLNGGVYSQIGFTLKICREEGDL